MTAVDGTRRSVPTLAVMTLAFGAASMIAWLVPGVAGMVVVGLAGTVATARGAATLLMGGSRSPRTVRLWGTVAVALGLLGLAGLWVTAIVVAAIPG